MVSIKTYIVSAVFGEGDYPCSPAQYTLDSYKSAFPDLWNAGYILQCAIGFGLSWTAKHPGGYNAFMGLWTSEADIINQLKSWYPSVVFDEESTGGTTGGNMVYTIKSRLTNGIAGTVTVVPASTANPTGMLQWNITAPISASFTFGAATDIPLIGDWTGSGTEGIGVYNPVNAIFYMKNSTSTGNPDTYTAYGPIGATPTSIIPISWYNSNTKKDSIAVFMNGNYYLKNVPGPGAADIVAHQSQVSCPGIGMVGQCTYTLPPPQPGISPWVLGTGLVVAAAIGVALVIRKKTKNIRPSVTITQPSIG